MSFGRRLKKLEAYQKLGITTHISVDAANCTLVVNDHFAETTPYVPPLTCLNFHQDNSFVRLLMGPYGSGKSTSCCAEIVFRAIAMSPCKDGIRRSRWAIVRNTYGDLESTSLQTWLQWFNGLGKVKHRSVPRLLYHHTFNDGNGIIELELMFIAMDRPDHVRKLKSLELTGVYLNELGEIPQAALIHFKGRVNRYPADKDCDGNYWSGIIADTNAPSTDHWLYDLFEVTRPESHIVFHQPAALLKTDKGYEPNPEAENIDHLKIGYDYYFKMMLGQSEEFIKVYVQGKYGIVSNGKSVYANYNDDLHSVESIDLDTEHPFLLAWDYGTVSPACLLLQHVEGQLRCIYEFVCSYMDPKELYNASVKPFLAQYCQGMAIEVIGDPADTYHGRSQLEECGLFPEAAHTNNIDARISAVKGFLNRLHNKQPSLLVSRKGCPKLRQGFISDYNYRRLRVVGEERYQDVPDKTHPFSDIHDCLQYGAMHYGDFHIHEEHIVMPQDLLFTEDDRSNVGGY